MRSDCQVDGDNALIARYVQNGDERAFAAIVERHDHFVRCVIAGVVRKFDRRSEIDDIVQEAWVRVARGLSTFRGDSKLTTWLHRIARNAAVAYVRTAARITRVGGWEPLALDDSKGMHAATPETAAIAQQLVRRVMAAVAELPEDWCVVVTLRDLHGISYADIARIVNAPIGTVRSRIARGRSVLEKALEPLF